jgi:hypothetical protein
LTQFSCQETAERLPLHKNTVSQGWHQAWSAWAANYGTWIARMSIRE